MTFFGEKEETCIDMHCLPLIHSPHTLVTFNKIWAAAASSWISWEISIPNACEISIMLLRWRKLINLTRKSPSCIKFRKFYTENIEGIENTCYNPAHVLIINIVQNCLQEKQLWEDTLLSNTLVESWPEVCHRNGSWMR